MSTSPEPNIPTPPPPSEPTTPQKPKADVTAPVPEKKKIPRKLIFLGGITGIVILYLIIALIASALHDSKKTDAISSTPTRMVYSPTPLYTSAPSITPVPTDSRDTIVWTAYPRGGYLTDYGLMIKYPKGWTMNYRKYNDSLVQNNDYTRVGFDMLPPNVTSTASINNWMGWGGMTIDIYKHYDDLKNWVADYLPNYKDKLTINSDSNIGGQTLNVITTANAQLPAFYIVQTNKHIYSIGFLQGGTASASAQIIKDIWPVIHFD